MEKLNIHQNIKKKLNSFLSKKRIPHIIFYGQYGSGKRHVLFYFLNKIYKENKEHIKKYVIYVNCAHKQGIRFFREELKFFARTHIQNNRGEFFKSIVLLNADKLTTDTQSALRRCIELYSESTRFFIIVEDKEKLLMPILSRFCDIYIPLPLINGERKSLYRYNLESIKETLYEKERVRWLHQKIFEKKMESCNDCLILSEELYNKGYSLLDLLPTIFKIDSIKERDKYLLKILFHEIRVEFRNESLLIFLFVFLVLLRPKIDLENINAM
uniref:Replication factor C (RfcS) n=1 Tax=uncultured marine group II/III euryarchaeote AD1000_88_G11 TaxID=1457822 RepID=A0A075G5E8_9EURY|nr:Replication factor C (rfcS) [uncultured marine group II/III euryarchaeote AD1000_88_G11]